MAGKRKPDEFGVSSDPRVPAPYNKDTAYAVKAFAKGEASKEQQLLVYSYLHKTCGTFDLEFRPDERLSNLASGKRFVGLQFRKLETLSPAIIEAMEKIADAKKTGD